jgi:hypothetical protein
MCPAICTRTQAGPGPRAHPPLHPLKPSTTLQPTTYRLHYVTMTPSCICGPDMNEHDTPHPTYRLHSARAYPPADHEGLVG